MPRRPRGLLFDYGGTLVDEVRFDLRQATEWLLTHAQLAHGVTIAHVVERAERVTREVSNRRDVVHIETPWVALTRLIHDALGTRFDAALETLELGFWNAGVETRPMPGVFDALTYFRTAGIPMGVVSNSSFRQDVIRHELSKHGLAEFMTIIIASADYAVRKPNPLIIEAAAGLLGVSCADTWFVGDRLDTDVAGAKAAGMTPVLLASAAGQRAESPAITVSHWGEIVQFVRDAR
jgi:putative hydrolase of the HAD superfamily